MRPGQAKAWAGGRVLWVERGISNMGGGQAGSKRERRQVEEDHRHLSLEVGLPPRLLILQQRREDVPPRNNSRAIQTFIPIVCF